MRDETVLTRARPLRTVLFTPGDQEPAIRDALAGAADAIVIDLENARSPFPEHLRVEARALVRRVLEELDPGLRKLVFVRVQPVESRQILKDLAAAVHPNLDGILLPGINRPEDVSAADAMLACFEDERGIRPGSTILYPILETATAIRLSYEIATASPRIRYMGGAVSKQGDIVREVGFTWTPEGAETIYIRQKVLIDCRAAGIRYPISGSWGGAPDDHEGVRAWARQLRGIGYYGMMLGSARLVPVVNECFTPRPDEVAYWKGLVAAADAADPASAERIIFTDPATGEPKVIHDSHIETARQGLEWATQLGVS